MATDTRDKSLVTSDGTESKIALTNPDGTQSNAVNAALNANKKRERIQFNPAFESRIDGFNERRTERAEARKQIVDFKRKEKLETQGKRLDKKVLRRTGEERTNKMSARQAADEVRINKLAQQLPEPIDLSESVKDKRLLMDPIDKTKKYGSISQTAGNKRTKKYKADDYATTSGLGYKDVRRDRETNVPGLGNYKTTKNYMSNTSFDINKYKQ